MADLSGVGASVLAQANAAGCLDCVRLRERVAELEKLFDDAGQGEYNVLALVDHYQSRIFELEDRIKELEKLTEELGDELVGYNFIQVP